MPLFTASSKPWLVVWPDGCVVSYGRSGGRHFLETEPNVEYENPLIRPGMEAMMARAAEADADPARPVYHFRPPSGWMNDVNGPLLHRGYYHIFYQLNPYRTDGRYGTHWGHARSADLVHWEHLPIAVWPSTELGESSCYSGTAGFDADGRPIILYTSTKRWGPGRTTLEPFEQWAAVGDDDLITWTKHPDNPILSLDRHGRPDFDWKWRDPFFFTDQGRVYVILGATGVGTPIWECESGDLLTWTYRGLASDISQECPNLFKLGGDWVMLTSPFTPVEYFVGDFDAAAYAFTHRVSGRMEPTMTFYGTNILFDGNGRCLLLGRLLRTIPGAPWNGCMAIPRVLTIGPDGRPRQNPAREIETLRGEHYALWDVGLRSESNVTDIRGDTLEITARIDPGDSAFCGMRVRRSSDGQDSVTIGYDGRAIYVGGIEMTYPLAPGQQTVTLRVFLDRSVVEVFVDDGILAASNYIDCGHGDLGVELFARGGAGAVDIDAWEMQPIW